MEKRNKERTRIYRSMMEIEREFFPILYKERLEEKKSKEPGAFGSQLATELLESIRQQLAK